ncbi:MAG: hypothetical protein Q4C64_01340 [Erysipelotrichia bacterium]|nr:hypothetical protein [Erysipelotrichia bacterium]
MDKLFKKIFVFCLSIMIFLSYANIKAATDVNTQDLLVENNEVSYAEEFEMSFSVSDLTYYPFIYHENNTWFNENVIGQADCSEGYLYIKNLDTGIIRKLVSKTINIFVEGDNLLFFIYRNAIYSVNYDGTEIQKLYQSNGIVDEKILELSNNNLYFTENNNICVIDLNSMHKNILVNGYSPDMIYIKSETSIVFTVSDEYYVIDSISNIVRKLKNESELRNLLNSSVSIVDTYSTAVQIDTNFDALLSEYPFGRYFTKYGEKCTHHGTGCSYYGGCNCKPYQGSIQCMAYARYGCDKYAHLSGWTPKSSDIWEEYERMSNGNDVKVFFSAILCWCICKNFKS